MRTADKHFPALVFRTMQKQPTTQPTPLTSSLGISPHLAASLGFWFCCWSSEKPGSNLACKYILKQFHQFHPFFGASLFCNLCSAFVGRQASGIVYLLGAERLQAAFWAAVWPMRQLWPSRLKFPGRFPVFLETSEWRAAVTSSRPNFTNCSPLWNRQVFGFGQVARDLGFS